MEKRMTFQAAAFAALVAFVCILIMGFGTPVPAGTSLQPSVPPSRPADFVRATNEFPKMALRFFAADSLFVLSYVIVFIGLYGVTAERAPVLATIGLGAGIVAALLDAAENAFFITYALLALEGVQLVEPAVLLIAVLANLKWMGAFAALYAFGLIWPRTKWLDSIVAGLMLLFPLVGVLGVASPALIAWRGLFFLVGMPLFAWSFWLRLHQTTA